MFDSVVVLDVNQFSFSNPEP